MLDPKIVTKMVEDQIARSVDDQVMEVFATDDWLKPIEQKIVQYTQDRILGKFNNSSALPEIVDAVKTSVQELFSSGKIPGIETFIDPVIVRLAVDQAVENTVSDAIDQLSQDSTWVEKIQQLANQAMVQRTVAQLSSIDIASVINQRVDENIDRFYDKLLKNFSTNGIRDQATQCQLTIMDDTTVFENRLTAREIDAVDTLTVKDLVVKGTINTDNQSWNVLAESISEKTMNQLTDQWKQELVKDVAQSIQDHGIKFDTVFVGDEPLVKDHALSRKITDTNIQKVGVLRSLDVQGETHLNNTVSVLNRRLGINTQEPEMALSVWDEEISVVIGKNKTNQAYIGTNRDHGIAIGVNRISQIEIDTEGLTTIKQLRIGSHRIGHSTEVPGWAGTRGDIIFNSNPGADRAFAWVCLGSYKWQTLKSIE
jgi:hypothetical protein